MQVVEHRGFVIQQFASNNHYIIYEKTDADHMQMVLHVACTEPLTEDELKMQIDAYLEREANKLQQELF